MHTYSKRQISAWEQSRITEYTPDGNEQSTGELGEWLLRSLFYQGFSLKGGKQDDGTQRVMTATGHEIAIHSKTLGTALRKRAKQHKWDVNRYLRDNDTRRQMAEMTGRINTFFQWLAVMDAAIGIEADQNSAAETYSLQLPGEIHLFHRETWTAPLEYLGRAK